MESIKNAFFLIIGIAIIAGSFYLFLQKPAPAHYQTLTDSQVEVKQQVVETASFTFVKIGENKISVEIADTDQRRSRGLSGRGALETGHGMLFLFPKSSLYGFWMKEMRFPIDIVWINEEHIIVGVERLVNPDTYPKLFYPPVPVKYVLEINSGEASRLGIDTGSRMYLGTEN